MSKTISFTLGPMAPDLFTQVRANDCEISRKNLPELYQLQKDADALVRCKVRGLMPDRLTLAAQKRLIDRIVGLLE